MEQDLFYLDFEEEFASVLAATSFERSHLHRVRAVCFARTVRECLDVKRDMLLQHKNAPPHFRLDIDMVILL